MDGLARLAQAQFDGAFGFRVSQAPVDHDTYELSIVPGSSGDAGPKTAVSVSRVSENDLASWARRDVPLAEASLGLVRIERIHNEIPNISKAALQSLVQAMGVHPAALYMVSSSYDGFHTFADPGSMPTWFFGTAPHALLWSFCPARRRTVVVFLERRRKLFQDFCRVLSAFASYIHAPQVLFLSAAVHQQHSFDTTTASELGIIHRIEQQTGFGPLVASGYSLAKTNQTRTVRAEIDELTVWSQAIGEIGVNLLNFTRHQRTLRTMLSALRQAESDPGTPEGVSGPAMDKYKTSLRGLCTALPALEQQLDTYDEYLLYLKLRTEKLSSVLFLLLTRVDARAGIGLASAAKRDSSSMKTVAIMTMAFLPGTFFAALFAMPLLEWDGSQIVQKGFWVYWVCTIPATLLVFGLWLGVTPEMRWLGGRGRQPHDPAVSYTYIKARH